MTPQEAILKECAEAKQKITESLINRIWRNNSTLIYSGSTEARIILEALEKQIPKKPTIADSVWHKHKVILCPKCNHPFNEYLEDDDYDKKHAWSIAKAMNKWCPNCGQALDWSDTE